MKYIGFVFGVVIVVGCFFGIWHILPPVGTKIDANSEHLIFMFAGGVFFGALLMMHALIIPIIKELLSVIGPYIPVIGGRRVTDPPASPPTPPSGGPI